MTVIEPIDTITVLYGFLIGRFMVTQSSFTIRPTGHASPKESARSRGVSDAAIPSQFLWPCAHIEEACVSVSRSLSIDVRLPSSFSLLIPLLIEGDTQPLV